MKACNLTAAKQKTWVALFARVPTVWGWFHLSASFFGGSPKMVVSLWRPLKRKTRDIPGPPVRQPDSSSPDTCVCFSVFVS